MTVEQNEKRIEELEKEKSNLKRANTNLDKRVDRLEYEMRRLAGKGDIIITLYSNQQGWSSAPSELFQIGPNGGFGESTPVWTIGKGEYTVLETYEVETFDYGEVRWVKLRTGLNDETTTPDQFAWMPVNPELLDAQELYDQLCAKDQETKVDDYTQGIWDSMKDDE